MWFHYRNLCWGKCRRSYPLCRLARRRPVTNFGVDIWWQQSNGEFLEPCGIMESNVFQMSQVVFFCCPPLAHFLPCQFLEPVSFPTACYGPASELLATLLLYPPSQGCLSCLTQNQHPFCLPPSCQAPLSSVSPPRLHAQALPSHYFCLGFVCLPLLRHSGDLALQLLPSWKSLDRLISPAGGGVGKAPALRGVVKGAVLLLGAASWVLPGSSCPWLWVTSEQKMW